MSKVKVSEQHNIYDASISAYNAITGVFAMCLGQGNNLDFDTTGLLEVEYDNTLIFVTPAISIPKTEPQKPTSYIAEENQSIYDLSLQLYGDVSFINIERSLDEEIAFGIKISLLEYTGTGIATQKQILSKKIATNFILAGTEIGDFLLTEDGFILQCENEDLIVL